MKKATIHRAAQAEMAQATRWYAQRNHAVAVESSLELERAIDMILQNSCVGAPHDVMPYRKYVLQKFPYTLFYRLTNDDIDNVYIAALVHQRRKPDYWTQRRLPT